jgi:hypothetical protein
MAPQRRYLVRYPGQLAAEDRAALESAGFKVYENGYGVSAAFSGASPGQMTMYQVVRVTADSEEDARQRVMDALGHEPADLRVLADSG